MWPVIPTEIMTVIPVALSVKNTDNRMGSYKSRRPCIHNNWDHIRSRRGVVYLRCRICELQWKMNSRDKRYTTRCIDFRHNECIDDILCENLHVNLHNLPLEVRQQTREVLRKTHNPYGMDLLVEPN